MSIYCICTIAQVPAQTTGISNFSSVPPQQQLTTLPPHNESIQV